MKEKLVFYFNVQNQSTYKSFRISDSTLFDKSPTEDKTFVNLLLITLPMAIIISIQSFSLPKLILLSFCDTEAAAEALGDADLVDPFCSSSSSSSEISFRCIKCNPP